MDERTGEHPCSPNVPTGMSARPDPSQEPCKNSSCSLLMEWRQNDITVVDDRKAVDLDVVHALLQQSYWANERPKDVIAQSLEHSLCFSVWKDGKQIGFARVVTDYAVFAWIADVMIDPQHRGCGAGKFLMQCVTEHPAIKHTTQTLTTRDAHGLYERYGFTRSEFMRKRPV